MVAQGLSDGLLNFIPIFGQMVCMGYCYGWGRDAAWNVHSPMPSRLFGNEDGKLYARGASALLIFLIAIVIMAIPFMLLPESTPSLLVQIVVRFGLFFAAIGILRMAIYGKFGAGFQLGKSWKMMTRDFGGFAVLVLCLYVCECVISIVCVLIFLLPLFVLAVALFGSPGAAISSVAYGFDNALASPSVPSAIIGFLLLLAAVYILSCAYSWLGLLQARALGHWMSQFDVASWGGRKDPLPFERVSVAAAQPTWQQASSQASYQAAPGMPVAGADRSQAPANHVQPSHQAPVIYAQAPYQSASSAPHAAAAPVHDPLSSTQAPIAQTPNQVPESHGRASASVQQPWAASATAPGYQPGSFGSTPQHDCGPAFCSHCGASLGEGAKFCASCGGKI